MPNITLSIPEALHEKMKMHSEIRWSDVVRKSISQKISDLEVLNAITAKSKLTQADVDELSHLIKKEAYEMMNKK